MVRVTSSGFSRHCKLVRPEPCATASAETDPGSRSLRMMRPALRCAAPSATIFRLAVITTSPVTFRHTKKKSSCAPHMFSPPPVMRYSLRTGSKTTLPLCEGAPTSAAPSKIPRLPAVCAAAVPARPSRISAIFFIERYGSIANRPWSLVGRTPGSARDALVPPFARRIKPSRHGGRPTRASAADPGVRPTIRTSDAMAVAWGWQPARRLATGCPCQAASRSTNLLRTPGLPRNTGWNGTARRHRNHQVLRRSAGPARRFVLTRFGRGAWAAGGERGGEVHADQSHHRRGEARLRDAHSGWSSSLAQHPGSGARAGHRGRVSAAGAVPGTDGGGEYRPGAGERLAVAAHRLARAAAAGARAPGTRRCGHRAPADREHAKHAGAAIGGDRQVDRRARQNPHPGRAHRFADRSRSGAPLPRDRDAARRGRGHHLYIAPAGRGGCDRRPRDRAARRPDRRHTPPERRGPRRTRAAHGGPRYTGDLSQTQGADWRGRARSARPGMPRRGNPPCHVPGAPRRNPGDRGTGGVGAHPTGRDPVWPDAL